MNMDITTWSWNSIWQFALVLWAVGLLQQANIGRMPALVCQDAHATSAQEEEEG